MSDNPGWAAWRHNFNQALDAYLDSLVSFSSCNGTAEHDDCRGEDCDSNLESVGYSAHDFDPGAAREAEEELHAFVTSCLGERPDCFDDMTPDMVGYDFYLTRNGHGCGFWDHGLGEVGKWLTGIAKPYGEASAYVGDDGILHYHG